MTYIYIYIYIYITYIWFPFSQFFYYFNISHSTNPQLQNSNKSVLTHEISYIELFLFYFHQFSYHKLNYLLRYPGSEIGEECVVESSLCH